MGLPGANVQVKGTTTGTATDFDGNFTLNVPANAATLVFSSIGYQTVEMPVQDVVNVTLVPDTKQIDEVIVTAYGVSKKGSITGAISKVSSESITKGNTESLDKSLAGKVAGVRISSTTGNPGAAGEVNVRGVGSINASTQPLYIVDGIALQTGNFGHSEMSQNALASINPSDIENISVLKDAAASSLYGSRAANGVIVITTKRGKEGKTTFNLKSSYGLNTMAVGDAFNMMSGPEYIAYVHQGLKGYYLNLQKALYPRQVNFANQASYEAAAQAFADANVGGEVQDLDGNTNWKKEVFQLSKTQEHQLSIAGGNEKTSFYTSFGLSKNEGLVKNSSFDRFAGMVNLDHKANKYLKIGVSESISTTEQKGFRDQSDQGQGIGTSSPLGIIFESDPTAPVHLPDGSYNHNVGFGKSPSPDEAFGGEMTFLKGSTYRNITNTYAQLDLFEGFFIKSTLGIDWLYQKTFEFWHPESLDGESLGGLGYQLIANNTAITSSTIANYNKTINEKHNFTGLLGFETSQTNLEVTSASANQYSTGKLPELSNGKPKDVSSSVDKTDLLSYFGRVEYNFDSKYYASGSLRTDGSSRLGADKRYASFYSVSASWRINKETFMENIDWLNELKLRASYGTNGTLPATRYGHLGLFTMSGSYNNESAIYVAQPENKELSWEMSKNLNVGLDVNVFKRFAFSIEYFTKYTSDLLLDVPSSYTTGFGSSIQNLGEISNNGIEVEAHTVNIDNNGFKWNTDLTFGYLKTNVEKLPGGQDIISGDGNLYMYSEGKDMYSFYLPKWHGVNPEDGLGYFYIDPSKPATADNLTYVYAEAQRGVVSKAIPDVTGGISNTFSYKGLELSFLITYQLGGNMFDYPGYFSHHDGVRFGSFNLAEDVAGNYWTQPGDVVDNPRPIYANSVRSDRWSTRHIHSTDHIRLKEVSLSYTIPNKLISNLGLSNVNIFAKATNLSMLWMKDKMKFDPEMPLNGYRTVDVPPYKTIMVGLSLSF